MNKVLLVGSSGLLGKSVKSRLLDDGFSVTSVTRSEGFDVVDYKCFKSLDVGYEYVINLAAIIQVSVDDIEEAVQVNGLGALNAAKFAENTGARYINASTISAISCCDDNYCKSYYAISKRLGDELIERYCDEGRLNYSILRFSQLYDSGLEAEQYQPMLYRIIKQLKYDKMVTLYGRNNPVRNYLHVDDAATAILLSMKDNLSGTWNCVHPSSVGVLELVNKVADLLNIPVSINRLENEEDLPDLNVPNKMLFHENHQGWHPRRLSVGLKDIVDCV